MKIIDQSSHLDALRTLLRSSTKRVVIISPWITNPSIIGILETGIGKWSAKVTIRWPSANDSPAAYDTKLLRKISELPNVDLCYVPATQPLHAKVYFAEGVGALITSANLTRQGFPTSSHIGNFEIGVLVGSEADLRDLEGWIRNLRTYNLNMADLEKIERWTRDYQVWTESIPEKAPCVDPPTHQSKASIEAALDFSLKNGQLRAFEHIPKGMGKKAYYLDLNAKRSRVAVRVIESVASDKPNAKYVCDYHFDIPRHDVIAWRNGDSASIKALVLVPLQRRDQFFFFDENGDAPISYIPFSLLFSPDNLRISDVIKKGKKKLPTIFLSKSREEKWLLRISQAYDKTILLENCIGTTA
ncbi:MAG: phospholipase D-like domain-containing protein [Gammaproteobacteria bacterium]